MIAATLFSGIGAPETAMPSWRWAWSAEIEKFPSAVLAARHPDSTNLGDVTADDFIARARAIARPDVLVFGSPCQDWSVAGKRLGLDGARGNLALTALRIVGELRPAWFVFENVPGLMSAWSGGPQDSPVTGECVEGDENSDFAAFLGTVDELGYSLCWARLDAQHFGVAQRRERVFAVGYLGDWRYPAAVLLEPESLCGNPPAREQARQDVAGAIGAGSARSGGRVGRREAAAGQLVAGTLNANGKAAGSATQQDAETGMLASHALRADGFDASEDGTGRGIPIIPICESGKRANVKDSPKNGMGIGQAGDPMFTLGADSRHAIAMALNAKGGSGRIDAESETFIAFDTTQITSGDNRCNPQAGDPCHPLPAHGHAPAVAFEPRMRGDDGRGYDRGPNFRNDCSPAINTVKPPAVAYQCHGTNVGEMGTLRKGDGGVTSGVPFIADPITASFAKHKGASGGKDSMPRNHIFTSGVRRLMPVECERLQGFPDGYTAITYRGKPAADGPRYKSLGNSMAVPVMRWILSRIEIMGGSVP